MAETITTPRAVSLTIPGMPAYALSPNSRCHWRVKHQESQAAKWAVKAALATYGMDVLTDWDFHGPVRLIWGINLAKRRKPMDRTNATATLKPFLREEEPRVGSVVHRGPAPLLDVAGLVDAPRRRLLERMPRRHMEGVAPFVAGPEVGRQGPAPLLDQQSRG